MHPEATLKERIDRLSVTPASTVPFNSPGRPNAGPEAEGDQAAPQTVAEGGETPAVGETRRVVKVVPGGARPLADAAAIIEPQQTS